MHRMTFLSLVFAVLLVGCEAGSMTAITPYRAGYAPDSTAQGVQFYADAAATGTARAIEFDRDLRNVQLTAQAGTQNALEAQKTALAQETQSALDRAATVQAIQATGTAQAYALEVTQAAGTAQAQATITQAARYAEATATAQAVTATPRAATEAAIIAQVQDNERRARVEAYTEPIKIIGPVVLWAVVLALIVLGLVLAYRRLMPVLELRLRTIPRGPHDAPLVLLDGLFVDLDRNFGPALLVGKDGATSTGYAPTPQLQERVTARDQSIDVIRALPHGRQERATAQRAISALNILQLPQGEPAQIEIITPDEAHQVGGWLAEVEHKLLTEGEEQ